MPAAGQIVSPPSYPGSQGRGKGTKGVPSIPFQEAELEGGWA